MEGVVVASGLEGGLPFHCHHNIHFQFASIRVLLYPSTAPMHSTVDFTSTSTTKEPASAVTRTEATIDGDGWLLGKIHVSWNNLMH